MTRTDMDWTPFELSVIAASSAMLYSGIWGMG